MSQNTFSMTAGVARNPLVRLAKPATATIGADEHIAIVGPNGGGKSLFVDTLIGKYPLREGTLRYDFSPSATQTVYDNVKYIAFRDTYGAADANYYYQQRWNAHDQDEAPDVREMLGEIKDEQLKNELFGLFRIEPLLDKKIILLSSGELRKFQLTKTLLTAPRVLIMDNPFIGLDAPTRALLFSLLDRLTKMSSVQIILVLSMLDDIPSFITHVIPVDKMEVFPKMERTAYLEAFSSRDTAVAFDDLQQRIIDLPYDGINYDADEVVKLNKVSIRYDDRTILKELDWTVRRGEKWALSGENGAGKSTLLSLVCADNPQSYACDISLFGRKRGTGESIWEIKKHIGYVSPEMHRAYLKNLPAIEIVASGLHDSIGLYKRPQSEQMAICEWWMDILVEHLEDNPYNIDEKEIEQCRKYVEERLAYFKEDMNGPRIRLKRKATDESLNIIGEDKLRCEVSFNGVKHKTIFDTGSEYYCIMNLYYAEKRGIKYDTCKVVKELINNTEFPVFRVTLDSVEMGNIIFYNLPVRLFDNDVIKYVPDSIKEDSIKVAKMDSVKNELSMPIIGLPTMQLIGKFLIDYENNTLSFPDTPDTFAMAKEPSLFFYGNKIYTQIKLNNVKFLAPLDTGCDGSIEIDSIFYEKCKNDIPIDTVTVKEQYNFLMLHRTWIDIPYEIPEKPTITFNGKPILPFGESDAPLRIYSMHPIWPNVLFDGVIGYDFFKRIGKKVLLDLDNMRLEAIE